jgi:hemolysin III
MTWLEQHISLHSNDSPAEELANGITHLAGAVLAVVGTFALVARADTVPRTITMLVFGVSMVTLFTASTAYHLSPPGTNWKRFFRLMDHLSIFLLIAGTYTPVMTAIATPWAWWTLAAVWTLAITGMTLKVFLWDRFGFWQVIFFLAMGWLAAVRLDVVLAIVPRPFFRLLLAGGLLYSAGTIVYALKRVPFHHAVWHLFVLGGAGAFFWGVLQYL